MYARKTVHGFRPLFVTSSGRSTCDGCFALSLHDEQDLSSAINSLRDAVRIRLLKGQPTATSATFNDYTKAKT
jgi:hypothetical protein